MAATLSERSRKLSNASLAVLVALGISAARPPKAAAESCNVSAKITNVLRHMRGMTTPFEATGVRPANHKQIVKVSAKHDSGDRQFMIDPLAIRCAGKIVRYLGITTQKAHGLGAVHAVGNGSGLYLDSVAPNRTTLEYDLEGDILTFNKPHGRLETTDELVARRDIHDIEGGIDFGLIPVFTGQTSHANFGRMAGQD